MEFHEKIRGMREDRDLTQTQVGQIMGMHQMKISRMETGAAEPSLSDLRAIALYYNVSADWLLGLPDNLPYPKRK